VDLSDVMNALDVWVSEGCGGLCLGLESLQVAGAGHHPRPDHLESDRAPERDLMGLEDNPHAAPTQLGQQLVVAEARSRQGFAALLGSGGNVEALPTAFALRGKGHLLIPWR